MGFLDKAKATATAAVAQGQAKVGALQQSRSEHELYRTLGEATYSAQRQGGDAASVDAALTALDAHFAQVAEAAVAQAAQAQAAGQAAGQAAPQGAPQPGAPAAPSGPAAAPPAGNFTLDDL